jgi:valyl-tRNA synthetase
LETIFRLAHPMMPFITEEIWQRIAPLSGAIKNAEEASTIMLQAFPQPDPSKHDGAAEDDIQWIKQVIIAVRNIRGEMDISPGKKLPVYLHNGADADLCRLKSYESFLTNLAKLEKITWLSDEAPPVSATQLVGDMEVLVPMAGLIDKDAESQRLQKEIDKLDKEIARLEGKLCNEKFISKAPAEVVEKEKEKLNSALSSKDKLKEQIKVISEI